MSKYDLEAREAREMMALEQEKREEREEMEAQLAYLDRKDAYRRAMCPCDECGAKRQAHTPMPTP
ncbi:hypothetical protein OHS59_16285 [Streptomyces sp. NBC_00414]|uniref:hypothetical protein n=1 Tax=Streptomyces sp. NBC_00414 TaxID=2975739 RepID=UPI002E1FADB0